MIKMKKWNGWIFGLIVIVVVLILRFGLWQSPHTETTSVELPSPSPSLEQLAEEGWMKGCTSHMVEEAQKVTDVVINKNAATAKAKVYCQCDWDYLRVNMGLSLDEVASVAEPDSRGSSAILEAQNYCYERYKGAY